MIVSGYKAMWVLVLFDLPVKTKKQRNRASNFRTHLVKDGFTMLQLSVYVRPCASQENANVHALRVKGMLPPEGQVRMLMLTDAQYGRQKVFWGKTDKPPEKQPQQLEFF